MRQIMQVQLAAVLVLLAGAAGGQTAAVFDAGGSCQGRS